MGGHRVFPTRSLLSKVAHLTALVLVQPVNVHSRPGDLFEQSRGTAEESSINQIDPAHSLFSERNSDPYHSTYRSYEELGEPPADWSASPSLAWSTTFSYAADHIPRAIDASVEEQIRESPTYLSGRQKEAEEGRSVKKSKLNSPSGFGTGSNFASSQRGSTAQRSLTYHQVFSEYADLLRSGSEEIEEPELFNLFHESHQGTANNLPTHNGLPRVNRPLSIDSLPSTGNLPSFSSVPNTISRPTTHLPSTNKLPITISLPSAESKQDELLRLEMTQANDETYAWIGSRSDLLEKREFYSEFDKLYEKFFRQVSETLDMSGLGTLEFQVKRRLKDFVMRVWGIHSQFLEMLAISANNDKFKLAQANLHEYLLRNILSSHESWLGAKSHSAGSGPSSFGWLHSQLSHYLMREDDIICYALIPNQQDEQVERRVTEQAISMTRMAVEIVGTYYKSLDYDKWRQFFEVDDDFLLLLSIIRWKFYTRVYAKYIDLIFPEMSKVENAMPWKEVLSSDDRKIINIYFKRHFELTIKKTIGYRLVPASKLTPERIEKLASIQGQHKQKRIVTLASIKKKKTKKTQS